MDTTSTTSTRVMGTAVPGWSATAPSMRITTTGVIHTTISSSRTMCRDTARTLSRRIRILIRKCVGNSLPRVAAVVMNVIIRTATMTGIPPVRDVIIVVTIRTIRRTIRHRVVPLAPSSIGWNRHSFRPCCSVPIAKTLVPNWDKTNLAIVPLRRRSLSRVWGGARFTPMSCAHPSSKSCVRPRKCFSCCILVL